MTIDLEKLAEQLPVQFVPVQANRGIGIEELKQALVDRGRSAVRAARFASPFPPAFRQRSRGAAAQS